MALGPGPAGLKFWTPPGITADSPPDDINNLPAGIGNQFNPWGPRRPVADWVLASPSFLISPTDTDNLPAGGANWFNPWGRKRPVADWFKGSVPLVPVTFTADSGSYALTGSAAFQALGHAAGSGSYTITGSAAALALGHVAGAGSYTLTGASAALALRHVAGAGSYTITGTAAGLVMPFTLTAAAGNYALTGTSAAFVIPGVADYLPAGMTGGYVPWGRRFPINLRSFTGRPLGTASTTFTLTAAGGSYAITGSAASFINLAPPDTANLPAGMTGSYVPWRRPHPVSLRTITGRPLAATFILTCGAGSYTLTGGTDVSFLGITPPTVEQPVGTYVGRGAGRGRMIRRRKPGELDLEPPPLEPSPPDLPPPAPGPKPPDLLPPQPGLMADMQMPQPKSLPPHVDEDEDEIALLLGLIS